MATDRELMDERDKRYMEMFRSRDEALMMASKMYEFRHATLERDIRDAKLRNVVTVITAVVVTLIGLWLKSR